MGYGSSLSIAPPAREIEANRVDLPSISAAVALSDFLAALKSKLSIILTFSLRLT